MEKTSWFKLIDFDMNIATIVEVAEIHHLAWTLAWMCGGVRPSSLGGNGFWAEKFMCWVSNSNR